MSSILDRITTLERSYDYHLKEMCRHDEILVWIDEEFIALEEYLTDGVTESAEIEN